ncbi:metallophosphoesterase family protein [Thermus tenuipuniceus]|uniref:metallophosphoesterase family protein n=1 Tax=Thermus tenuipuniceus TaxID=2078690 RepID=UPI000CF9E563|nr:metallophosphoesterase family protein [Thermus tenuipuniceus]
MRILILSDLHGNTWALQAILRAAGPVEAVLFAGDVVNYGPSPRGVVSWLRRVGAVAVRGNHDHAVAFGGNPKAAPRKAPLAGALLEWTKKALRPEDLAYLRSLPLYAVWAGNGVRFALIHGSLQDPLYDYRLDPQAGDEALMEAAESLRAEVVVFGHTHLPFIRRIGDRLFINPGSAGQPLDGDPRASFVLYEEGRAQLYRVQYDLQGLLGALEGLPLGKEQRAELRRLYERAG